MPAPLSPFDSRPLVVVADADAALCDALKFSLEAEGFDVATCADGEDLLRRSLPAHGTCLVVDDRLPNVSGLDALGQLRPVMITTHPGEAVRKGAKAVAAPIVEKPLLGDVLLEHIRAALDA
jgi:FixJ family two-component response regulator